MQEPDQKVLFLDVDGVLHSSTTGELVYTAEGRPRIEGPGVCEHEPLLAGLMAGHAVTTAIHSSWVRFGLPFLREYLPNVSAHSPLHLTKAHIESRAERVRDIVRRWKLAPHQYRILDDSVHEFDRFPELLPQLIACPPHEGLRSPEVQRELLLFLRGTLK
jgi:hypothetical protein